MNSYQGLPGVLTQNVHRKALVYLWTSLDCVLEFVWTSSVKNYHLVHTCVSTAQGEPTVWDDFQQRQGDPRLRYRRRLSSGKTIFLVSLVLVTPYPNILFSFLSIAISRGDRRWTGNVWRRAVVESPENCHVRNDWRSWKRLSWRHVGCENCIQQLRDFPVKESDLFCIWPKGGTRTKPVGGSCWQMKFHSIWRRAFLNRAVQTQNWTVRGGSSRCWRSSSLVWM